MQKVDGLTIFSEKLAIYYKAVENSKSPWSVQNFLKKPFHSILTRTQDFISQPLFKKIFISLYLTKDTYSQKFTVKLKI